MSTRKVRCEGCMALTPECWGYNCKIVQCLRIKSLNFRYQCSEYTNSSCEKFEKLSKSYLEENGVNLRANLDRIRKGEVKKWLLENQEKYKCLSCGKPLPVYGTRGKCHHCGAKLAKSSKEFK